MRTLHLRAFRAWLEGLGPEELCGRAQHPHHCPLSRYLRLLTGQCVVVGEAHYAVCERWTADSPRTVRRLPAWARRFRCLVDSVPGDVVAGSARTHLQRACARAPRRQSA